MLTSYALAGAGFGLVATANGALRDLGYRRLFGEQRAHQLSSVTFAALFGGYTWLIEARWPLRYRRDAAIVGAMWMATGAGFDLGIGHYVDHKPWRVLLRDYNLAAGRLWGLDVAWIGVAPEAVRMLRARRYGDSAYGGAG
ncbi:MAG TPA: hypothetical protein VFY79_07545 [Dehalococcoidia bacterium]|nr:hypothetical protein [Dehalococcoidia bacterium]